MMKVKIVDSGRDEEVKGEKVGGRERMREGEGKGEGKERE